MSLQPGIPLLRHIQVMALTHRRRAFRCRHRLRPGKDDIIIFTEWLCAQSAVVAIQAFSPPAARELNTRSLTERIL